MADLKFQKEYEEDLKRTKEFFIGHFCISGCNGKMGEPKAERTDILAQCPFCGVGLKKPTYTDFVQGKRTGTAAGIRYAKEAIEQTEKDIAYKRKEIKLLQEALKENKATLKKRYAEARKWR